MKLKLKIESDPQYYLNLDADEFPTKKNPHLARFFAKCHLYAASFTVTATLGDQLVGCLRMDQSGPDDYGACGTWVRAGYRRLGIATKLWKHFVKVFKPKYVTVYTVSKAGSAFAQRLRARYGWEFLEISGRGLSRG